MDEILKVLRALNLLGIARVLSLSIISIILFAGAIVGYRVYTFLWPHPQVHRYTNTSYLSDKQADQLITSSARIDQFVAFVDSDEGSKEAVVPVYDLKELYQGRVGEQKVKSDVIVCVYTIDVYFGYNDRDAAQVSLLREELLFPDILAINVLRYLEHPRDKAGSIRRCHDYIHSAIDRSGYKHHIFDWMRNDKVWAEHMAQGARTLLTETIFSNQAAELAMPKASAGHLSSDDITKSESNGPEHAIQKCGGDVDNLPSFVAQKIDTLSSCVKPWEATPKLRNEKCLNDTVFIEESSGKENGGEEVSAQRGVYKVTFSTLAMVDASGRKGLIPFTLDDELVMRRDISKVTYGSAIRNPRMILPDWLGRKVLNVPRPRQLTIDRSISKLLIFGNSDLDELSKGLEGVPISSAINNEILKSLELAIDTHEPLAIRNAEQIIIQQLSIAVDEGVAIKFEPTVESDILDKVKRLGLL